MMYIDGMIDKDIIEIGDSGIGICSRDRIVHLLQSVQKPCFHVVSIRTPDDGIHPVDGMVDKALSVLPLEFDDVISTDLPLPPTHEHILELIDWSRDKDPIIIHCEAGVSRSSACAVAIAASRMSIPLAIEKVLNPWLHWPNELVIKHAAEILWCPQLESAMEDWRKLNLRNSAMFL